MFFPLSQLLPQSLRKYKIAPQTEAYLICKKANQLLKKFIHKKIQARCLYLKDKILWIRANSPAEMNEIKNYEYLILNALQTELRYNKIEEIKIVYRAI